MDTPKPPPPKPKPNEPGFFDTETESYSIIGLYLQQTREFEAKAAAERLLKKAAKPPKKPTS